MDIKLLEDQLSGITAKGKEWRKKEQKFLKAQGLDEEIAKTEKDLIDLESKLPSKKDQLAELIKKKNAAVAKSIKSMAEKMAEVLPEGMSVFEIAEDGSFNIGWDYGDKYRPYEGLSGGEKVQFDLALCHAMDAGLLIMEAAETDNTSLIETMAMLTNVPKQVMISTCHPVDVPEGWAHIQL